MTKIPKSSIIFLKNYVLNFTKGQDYTVRILGKNLPAVVKSDIKKFLEYDIEYIVGNKICKCEDKHFEIYNITDGRKYSTVINEIVATENYKNFFIAEPHIYFYESFLNLVLRLHYKTRYNLIFGNAYGMDISRMRRLDDEFENYKKLAKINDNGDEGMLSKHRDYSIDLFSYRFVMAERDSLLEIGGFEPDLDYNFVGDLNFDKLSNFGVYFIRDISLTMLRG